jgi:hypothetical protein
MPEMIRTCRKHVRSEKFIMVIKSRGKLPRKKIGDNIKMNVREIGWMDVGSIWNRAWGL